MEKGKGKKTGTAKRKDDVDTDDQHGDGKKIKFSQAVEYIDDLQSLPAKRSISDVDDPRTVAKKFKSISIQEATSSQSLHVGQSSASQPPEIQRTFDQPSQIQRFSGTIMINDPEPPWAPDYEMNEVLRSRESELREQFRQAGIPIMPNYSVYERYITYQGSRRHDQRSFDELLEYTRNRMWLEKYTSYKQLCRQQWRQHGFRSIVVSQHPYITSAEARALQLWVETITADFVTFENVTGTTPPEKYWAVIYGFAHDFGNEQYL